METSYIIKILLTLFYTQQTLVLYWCFSSEKITGTLYSGYLSSIIFMFSFFGNMTLGPFKNYIDSNINKTNLGRISAGIIPQLIFGFLVSSIYFQFKWLTIISIILWYTFGMVFVSASDSIIDDSGMYLLGSTSNFAITQYVGSRILARLIFSYITDNYSKYNFYIYCFSLSSIIFSGIIYMFLLPFHKHKNLNNKTFSFNNLSYLIYPPLFMILFESIFLDIPLSSLKFIVPRFCYQNNYFMTSSLISNVEILFSSLLMAYISYFGIFKNLNFKQSWEKYSYFHTIASLFRILSTILLVYIMNIQQVDYTDKYYMASLIKKSFTGEEVFNYAMITHVNLNIVKLLILLVSVSNTLIDCFSNVVMVILLKNYSKNKNVKYSELDGWIRLFTYFPLILPWLKRNPMLSFYNSQGYLINSMMFSTVLYGIIQYWNFNRLNKT